MKEIDEIINKLIENLPAFKERYKIKSIGVFGSHVRGEELEDSDIDVLIEVGRGVTLFQFLALERELSELLGKKVDLVSKRALKPLIGKHILEEVIYVLN